MTAESTPPGAGEIELTLFGPGYGESIALHIGDGVWMIVDSCIDDEREPRALRYLENLGLDPAHAVALVVATHWHDDHIRGMARLLDACSQASFCCAAVFCQQEFLSAVAAFEHRHLTVAGSGVRELYEVFTHLREAGTRPTHAVANRRVFARGACEVWSLSPSDAAFQEFLGVIGALVPREGQAKTRIPDHSPNDVAVALWIGVNDIAVLLGSDLERRGWLEILQSTERPLGQASVFKVAHHGSGNSDVPEVWRHMLITDPVAVLTPWQRGGRLLPTPTDVNRILSSTTTAFASAHDSTLAASPARRSPMVDRTIRESGVHLRRPVMSPGAVRLRRLIGGPDPWQIELFGAACHLRNFNRR